MTFSCDRCHGRFSTSEDPVPGRTYRVPCGCGNVILMSSDEPDPFATQRKPSSDDPFARAAPHGGAAVAPAPEVTATATIIGPLARRDPSGPSDEFAEDRITGATSFDDILGRARRQGFLAGSATGALVGAVVAAAVAVLAWRGLAPTPNPAAPARVEPTRVPAATPQSHPASSAVPTRRTGSATSANVAVPARRGAAAAAPRRVSAPRPSSEAGAGTGPEPASSEAARRSEPELGLPSAAVQPLDEQELSAALRARRDALDACVSATPGDADPPVVSASGSSS